jgi:two-component system, chemotaxis family, sensor kinase CheA
MIDPELAEVFRAEASEIIENIERDLVVLEEHADAETINRLFRYFHTMKGSSGIAGLDHVSEFTHKLENLLDNIRSNKMKADREIIDLLLESIDWIRGAIARDDDIPYQPEIRDFLLKRLEVIKNREETAVKSEEKDASSGFRVFRIKAQFRPDIFTFGIDPLMIIEDLIEHSEIFDISTDCASVPPLSELDPEKCYANWRIVAKAENVGVIDSVFMFVRDDNPIEITDITIEYENGDLNEQGERKLGEILVQKGIITNDELTDVLHEQNEKNEKLGEIIINKGYATEKDLKNALGVQEDIKKKTESGTVRVDTGKLDRLMNLLGEIVIGQSAIARFAETLDENEGYTLRNSMHSLDRTTREFQEQIMSIRMIPIGSLFMQFKRFVRDTARSLGKDINLIIEGSETEFDKTVIERIGDPLKHMVRNAIDHGVETREEREKAGKNPAGNVKLNAYHQEGNVFIEVSDDGKGIDLAKVAEKARLLGLIKSDEDISRDRVTDLIFIPGLSTAEKVGDLSGRGVGMDVVKTNIESLRGTIEVFTDKGSGSMFRIKLPLTLAIIEGMLCKVGRSIYIIPLLSIIESIRPAQKDVQTVEGKGEVVFVRGEFVPLIRLYNYFGIPGDFSEPWESLVIIVESAGKKVALMIDDLLGQQQIVIKNLDSLMLRHGAISGAAILGDGNVALIIDIHGMLNEISKRSIRNVGVTV